MPFRVGSWEVDPDANTLSDAHQTVTLEPKVMDLLRLLASEPGRVFARDELMQAIWPGVIVGEDSLARAVSKLRRALGDQRESPQFIATIPKRGYRLIADVQCPHRQGRAGGLSAGYHPSMRLLLFAGVLGCLIVVGLLLAPLAPKDISPARSDVAEMTERANDLYMRFRRGDNEAAIALYERVIAADPAYAPAQAGLANALVQRSVRWQGAPGDPAFAQSVGQALSLGLTVNAEQEQVLERAAELAERAIRLSPRDADAFKAFGLVLSAQGKVDQARQQYQRAIELDPQAWEAMANLAELTMLSGEQERGMQLLEQTYNTMQAQYGEEPQRIGPWLAPLGVLIGDAHLEQNDRVAAEAWYRQVLDQLPFEPIATTRLATLLREQGETQAAKRLCDELSARVGDYPGCDRS